MQRLEVQKRTAQDGLCPSKLPIFVASVGFGYGIMGWDEETSWYEERGMRSCCGLRHVSTRQGWDVCSMCTLLWIAVDEMKTVVYGPVRAYVDEDLKTGFQDCI